MIKYFLQKLAITIIVIFGAATCAFLLMHLIPGDKATALAGPQASAEDVENLRQAMHLDEPLGTQYISYLRGLLKGDLGYSYRNHRPVFDILSDAWPATFKLALVSMMIALLAGVPLGVFAAVHRGRTGDTMAMVFAFLGISMPSFWLALLLIIVFGVKIPILPFFGMKGLTSYILPGITLGVVVAANIARLTRTSMLEVLGQDYIRTARGKGVSQHQVIWRHALKNAGIPVVTIIGLQFGVLLGGQVVTETIFSWPGIGRVIVNALDARDMQIVQGGILILAFTFAIINLLVDLIYSLLDPRIRY